MMGSRDEWAVFWGVLVCGWCLGLITMGALIQLAEVLR